MRVAAQQNELNEKHHLDEYISIANKMEKKIKKYESDIEILRSENEKLKNELSLKISECNNYTKDLKSVVNEKQYVCEVNSKLESKIKELEQQLSIFLFLLLL